MKNDRANYADGDDAEDESENNNNLFSFVAKKTKFNESNDEGDNNDGPGVPRKRKGKFLDFLKIFHESIIEKI